jgi:hypothetical protein
MYSVNSTINFFWKRASKKNVWSYLNISKHSNIIGFCLLVILFIFLIISNVVKYFYKYKNI